MIPPTLLWAGLALAAALGGLLRGATAFGGSLILAPAFVILVGARESTVLIVLIHAVTGLQGLNGWRRVVRWSSVTTLALTAVVCTAIFSHFINLVDATIAKRITGFIVIALALLRISGWRWHHQGGPVPVFVTGVLSGACTATSGIGGPPAVVYYSGAADSSESVRGNLLAYFALLFSLSGFVLAAQNRVTMGMLVRVGILAPIFYAGSVLGQRLFHWMGHHHFDRAIAGILVLAGAVILIF